MRGGKEEADAMLRTELSASPKSSSGDLKEKMTAQVFDPPVENTTKFRRKAVAPAPWRMATT